MIWFAGGLNNIRWFDDWPVRLTRRKKAVLQILTCNAVRPLSRTNQSTFPGTSGCSSSSRSEPFLPSSHVLQTVLCAHAVREMSSRNRSRSWSSCWSKGNSPLERFQEPGAADCVLHVEVEDGAHGRVSWLVALSSLCCCCCWWSLSGESVTLE